MKKLKEFNGQEVYIIIGDEDEDVSDIFVTESWEDLVAELATKTPDVDSDVRVFHGVLHSAEFLPNSFHGKSAFVVIQDPSDLTRGCLVESCSDSPEEVAADLTNVIDMGGGGAFTDLIDIDDIFLLYGYQMNLCITVSEEEVDEEIISAGEMIVDEVKEVQKFMQTSV